MDINRNGVYQSDCLVLLEHMDSGIVTLVYIDPPTFTSSTKEDEESKALTEHLSLISKVLQQIHRVLNANGNLFFHSEHYLSGDYRKILDRVFGRKNFRLEIILPNFRTKSSDASGPKMAHHTIFCYSKGDNPTYNKQFKQLLTKETHLQSDDRGPYKFVSLTKQISRPSFQFEWKGTFPPPKSSWIYSKQQLDELDKEGRIYQHSEGQPPRLKVYIQEEKGIEIDSIWDDIFPIPIHSPESLTFQAQQPLHLMNRIIKMGSNPDDLVLDPFCGSGTTLKSAHLNERRWLGCDLSTEAYSLTVKRIENECQLRAEVDFNIGDQLLLEQTFPVIYGTYAEAINDFDKQLQASKFIVDQPISIEETRYNEFKEIKISTNPVERIKELVDEYVVAFLNREGGQIFWGIRDDKTVSGVKLNGKQRDEIRRAITDKLYNIQPPIAPSAFRVEFHHVYKGGIDIIPDLYVVQLVVPTVSNKTLYYTSSGKAFVRTDGANKELKGLLLQAEILKRFSNH